MILEYIWIDGNNGLRSKIRIVNNIIMDINDIPLWNYDGSSTNQADSNNNTEVILKPCAIYKNPFFSNLLVLCETYNNNDEPLETNTRFNANQIFNLYLDEEPWFGLEQEFFIIPKNENITNNYIYKTTKHYCGSNMDYIDRQIVEEHLKLCLDIGLHISGINAEVSAHQWEFQIGPCVGINASDELIVARYLLERIAEKYNRIISYKAKLLEDINGSGCHTNFSTRKMREEEGLKIILECMSKLEKSHNEYIKICGDDNKSRLTGLHETSNYNNFSYGIGTRNTSVRIGNQTYNEKKGYFEDRRPSADMDPYLVTSSLLQICVTENV
jgi:glutamine synthetase